ncbi:hypothetical protein BV898_02834 [Hypsibius exemplaris]|uniref:Uncharacterized protein n=1 Tax=Hypsibius exemplaris TaxID=2072580 RepID=A0A1W0X7K3_HYPEX|nr:hypothetical protein BV898_02834 [Hypsibius exemplaris]
MVNSIINFSVVVSRDAVRTALLTYEATKWQYIHGVNDSTLIAPESYELDWVLLRRPGSMDIHLDLFRDYFSHIKQHQRSFLSVDWSGSLPERPSLCASAPASHGTFRLGDPRIVDCRAYFRIFCVILVTVAYTETGFRYAPYLSFFS